MQWIKAEIDIPAQPFLDLNEVSVAVGYSVTHLKRWIKAGKFPKPRRVAGGGKKWSARAIGVWRAWQDYDPTTEGSDDDADEEESDEEAKSDQNRPSTDQKRPSKS